MRPYIKYTNLIILVFSLLLITACDNKTTAIEKVGFFEYAYLAVDAEVSYEDNLWTTDELLETFLNIDGSDVQEITEISGEGQEYSLYIYRSPRRNDVLYRLQFYLDGTDYDIGDELKVHAYNYMTTGEPDEGYFAISDEDFIEIIEDICESLHEED